MKNRIVTAATTMYGQLGFRAVTSKQVAAKAGVNDATVYRYFPTKIELQWAVLEDVLNHLRERYSQPKRLPPECTTLPHFKRCMVDLAIEVYRIFDDDSVGRLILFACLEEETMRDRMMDVFLEPFFQHVIVFLEDAGNCGLIKKHEDHYLSLRTFLSLPVYHWLTQEIFGFKRHRERQWPLKAAMEYYVESWLEGEKTTDPGAASSSKRSRPRSS